jgi:hypothetical protein
MALHNVSVILWGVGVKPLRGAKPHTPIILLLCNALVIDADQKNRHWIES